MPKIVVHRETEWANKARKVAIFLNGKKLGTIEDRQVIAFEVPEGEQELVAKIDWCRSNKLMLHLQPDELEHVKIEGFVFSSYFSCIHVGPADLSWCIFYDRRKQCLSGSCSHVLSGLPLVFPECWPETLPTAENKIGCRLPAAYELLNIFGL